MNEYIFLYEDACRDCYKIIVAENILQAICKFYDYCGGRLDNEYFNAIVNNCDTKKVVDDFSNFGFVTIKYILYTGQYLYTRNI
ncbi:MAG: hypothetical protein KBT27_13445 [Prevotellaceae bacterium]|nr:hypothetical protein [Candidatus Faecinaster equi]